MLINSESEKREILHGNSRRDRWSTERMDRSFFRRQQSSILWGRKLPVAKLYGDGAQPTRRSDPPDDPALAVS